MALFGFPSCRTVPVRAQELGHIFRCACVVHQSPQTDRCPFLNAQEAFRPPEKGVLPTVLTIRIFAILFSSGTEGKEVFDKLLKTLSEVNDAEWNDVLGMLKVQGTTLDLAQLAYWTQILHAGHLLPQALEDAGLFPSDETSSHLLAG